MALKIFTEAKPFPKANIKPFDITEIEILTIDGDPSTESPGYVTIAKAKKVKL